MPLATRSVSVSQLRSSRRALRDERARVCYWRRLVSARLDLAVASAAPPAPLGLDPAMLPAGAVLTAPPASADIARALPRNLPISEIHHLDLLYRLDEQLATYQFNLDTVLAATTEQFIERLSANPLAALAGMPKAHRRG